MLRTIGLLNMNKEKGEKRAFLPDFIKQLVNIGYVVFLEKNYGKELGFKFKDYFIKDKVFKAERDEIFKKDVVMVIRAPEIDEFQLLGDKSILFTMLHFPTRERRIKELLRLNKKAISMDSVVDDWGLRLIENMKAVGWNGLEVAFDLLEEKGIFNKNKIIKVLIIGTGMLGKHAVDAAVHMGNRKRNEKYIKDKKVSVIANVVGRNITIREDIFKEMLKEADIIVDATQRHDPSKPIIKNKWIKIMKNDAIIVDLVVDPYILNNGQLVVKGIEGIPQGNLDKYVFYPDDPDWNEKIPDKIPSDNRRITISCYSWPGIYPLECMKHYGLQILPFMRILKNKSYDEISKNGTFFERALYRAKLHTFIKENKILNE